MGETAIVTPFFLDYYIEVMLKLLTTSYNFILKSFLLTLSYGVILTLFTKSKLSFLLTGVNENFCLNKLIVVSID